MIEYYCEAVLKGCNGSKLSQFQVIAFLAGYDPDIPITTAFEVAQKLYHDNKATK